MIGYQLYVRSFRDGNFDGLGDFKGLISSIGYFKDIGVDFVWLMPVFSSISFHGYDVVDFYSFKAEYGTVEEFKKLVCVFHENGMKIVLDLPIHHTSFLHLWFQKAMKGDQKYKDYYVWADDKTNLDERRDWDGERIWHPLEDGRYYRGLFGPLSPDLNYNNPKVFEEMKKLVQYLLEMGVDGVRFDAAKHMKDSLEQNVRFWRHFLSGLDGIFLAEIWAEYKVVDEHGRIFGYMLNFDTSHCIKEAIWKENASILVASIERALIGKDYLPVNFTSNHDMSRLASFEDGFIKEKVKLSLSILFTLPGVPLVFYGDELGMKGIYRKPHTEEVLDPFPWSENMCVEGQAFWKWPSFNEPFSGISVEHQKKDPNSVFSHFLKWATFRKENPWLDNAELEFLCREGKLLVYRLKDKNHSLKVFHNLSGEEHVFEGVHVKAYSTEVI
ncbi:alpha-amylase family glycosyl hydrolase [Thermotoga sp. KOL6]|uniref:alpha-amylase family glycosyl hydrolase n=1 Tax=Thermotoga sp. KOL6 TaxID=126741 RepID=UPI000C75BF95|nr:alpha-amylase family glycosyl hydrolase [Thermotoga sp. KOL6]PLV59101.1 4-alpha-glucanotransferase [Thermotoga sp. KOL6]